MVGVSNNTAYARIWKPDMITGTLVANLGPFKDFAEAEAEGKKWIDAHQPTPTPTPTPTPEPTPIIYDDVWDDSSEGNWGVEYTRLEPAPEAFVDIWAIDQEPTGSWNITGGWDYYSAEYWGISLGDEQPSSSWGNLEWYSYEESEGDRDGDSLGW